MNTLKIHHKAVSLCLIALSLTILTPSFTRTSQASTGAKVVNAAQNEALDFTLVNETGYAIKKVYIGPNNNPEWSEDMEILHGRAFKSGTEIEVVFNPKARSAKWDLRVEWSAPYEKDPPADWYGLDLTKITKLTLLYNADTGKTSIRRN